MEPALHKKMILQHAVELPPCMPHRVADQARGQGFCGCFLRAQDWDVGDDSFGPRRTLVRGCPALSFAVLPWACPREGHSTSVSVLAALPAGEGLLVHRLPAQVSWPQAEMVLWSLALPAPKILRISPEEAEIPLSCR